MFIFKPANELLRLSKTPRYHPHEIPPRAPLESNKNQHIRKDSTDINIHIKTAIQLTNNYNTASKYCESNSARGGPHPPPRGPRRPQPAEQQRRLRGVYRCAEQQRGGPPPLLLVVNVKAPPMPPTPTIGCQ